MQKYDDNFNINFVDEKTLDQLQAIVIIWDIHQKNDSWTNTTETRCQAHKHDQTNNKNSEIIKKSR